MAITRLSSANPYDQTIEDIDKNIFELNGKINQAKFNKNEIDTIYSDITLSRKYKILSGAGNSTATYTNWSHVTAESGYSIWKIPFTEFNDNTLNEMYLDNTSLTYKGEGDQEAYTSFDAVYLYNGTAYVDNTTEAATEVGTAFALMAATDNYLYAGSSAVFAAVDFDFNVKGSNCTIVVEYYNGATWTTLTSNVNTLVDNTSNFKSDGRIEYTLPTDWATVAVDGTTKYWLRLSTSTTPVTTATAYSIFPGNSITSLLQLSNSNVLNDEWAWSYFNDNVYATVRNAGNSAYEGNKYITSSSTATNKENYFVYNHAYKVSYEKSDYATGADLPTTASAGGGEAVPATIVKYLPVTLGGEAYKIALFDE